MATETAELSEGLQIAVKEFNSWGDSRKSERAEISSAFEINYPEIADGSSSDACLNNMGIEYFVVGLGLENIIKLLISEQITSKVAQDALVKQFLEDYDTTEQIKQILDAQINFKNSFTEYLLKVFLLTEKES